MEQTKTDKSMKRRVIVWTITSLAVLVTLLVEVTLTPLAQRGNGTSFFKYRNVVQFDMGGQYVCNSRKFIYFRDKIYAVCAGRSSRVLDNSCSCDGIIGAGAWYWYLVREEIFMRVCSL